MITHKCLLTFHIHLCICKKKWSHTISLVLTLTLCLAMNIQEQNSSREQYSSSPISTATGHAATWYFSECREPIPQDCYLSKVPRQNSSL